MPIETAIPETYAPYGQSVLAAFGHPSAVTTERDVAEVIWRAANDSSARLKYPAGPDAVALAKAS
jgi:hypothetical protein